MQSYATYIRTYAVWFHDTTFKCQTDPKKTAEVNPKPTCTLKQTKEELEKQLALERECFAVDKENFVEEIASQKEEFERELCEQQQSFGAQIEQLQLELAQHSLAVQNVNDMIQQYEFLVPEYSRLKRDNVEYTTPPMYTGPGGYKFVIKVMVGGTKTGLGSHVSISGYSQVGEHDANLTFPVKNMLVTLQLLNQHDKTDNHETIVHMGYARSKHGEFLGAEFQYISHRQLDQNAAIYLKHDKLWFRITHIKIETARHRLIPV